MKSYLDFEKPLEALDLKIDELKQLHASGDGPEQAGELADLEKKARELHSRIFASLTPWQKCQVARHPDRPYTMDYIGRITDEFVELHGDRTFGDDPAIIGGLASIVQSTVLILGHQKGRSTKERIMRNFGQPHPEGYRKALRLMKLAERFNIPVITFIDTPGAYPGLGSEERGQSEAIAVNLMEMSRLRVPVISIVIGEGGSGGALALSVADRLYMLEHSVYSVISPEGCAAILWKTEGKPLGQEDFANAASALKLTAHDLMDFKIVDGIIEEPYGGAHRNVDEMAKRIKKLILECLMDLQEYGTQERLAQRYEKFRHIGALAEWDMG